MAILDRVTQSGPRPLVYPESDGEPIGETDVHISAILYLRQALRWMFRKSPDIYVAANMLLYFEEGEPASRTAPDVFVVKGVSIDDRRTYKVWEEGVPPCTIIEVTSKSSRLDDVGTKRGLYELLGVSEYLLFDPLDEYLRPRFRAFQLHEASYQPVSLEPQDRFVSTALGVGFQPDGRLLRVVDLSTNEPAPLLGEAMDVVVAAQSHSHEARREADEARREADEARREADEARREADEARREADEARREADVARKSEQEARREALDAEGRIAALEAQLRRGREP